MENRAHALAAGIFTILLGVAAAIAIWWLGQSDDSTTSYVLETRRNVTGLNVQAQVRYRGIRAGKVRAIEPDPVDQRVILVTVDIDSRFKLTRGSTAQLGYQGVTGLAYVLIEDDDRNVQNLSRTMDNLATASDGLREMPAVLASVKEALSDKNMRSLRQILGHVEATAGEAAPLAVEMRDLVKSMGTLARRFEQVAGSAGDELTATTLPRANALIDELSTSSRQLSRILDGLESNPQMLLLGRDVAAPGPGEAGFVAPVKSGGTK
jgi:phospholipid/cholesterol/gamma-HCH transport system substrate-binding protein